MSNPQKTIKIWFLFFITLAIISYILFQSKSLILGPQLTVSEPKNGATLTYNLVTVKGVATNISLIKIDDRAIFVDDHGNFSEKLIAPEGYSIIKVEARDRFGKMTEKFIHVYLPEHMGAVETHPATSTTATSTTPSS